MPRPRVPPLLALLGAGLLLFAPRGVKPARPLAPAPSVAPVIHGPPPPPATTFAKISKPSATPPLASVLVGAHVVALDLVYHPAAGFTAIPAQPGLDALLAHLAHLPAPAPGLVVYPARGPFIPAARRILRPGLHVTLASPDAPTPAVRPDLGITGWERPAHARAHALARITGDAAQPLRAAAALSSEPGLVAVRPLLARPWAKKLVPDDPLFRDQWHLRNTGQQGGRPGVDIRAVPAWDAALGHGVTIGVVDDGIDAFHPDLTANYAFGLGHDWNDQDDLPYPVAGGLDGDNHGTAVAGLAAARGHNALGVSGVAPRARLAGLRLIAAPTDDSEDAAAMAWRNDVIAIKNNSWGPPDADGANPENSIFLNPPGPLWRAAILDGVANGRAGRGTLYVFAAGNGRKSGDQGAKDGYSSLRGVIAAAAVTHRGAPASFSEGGPHLVVAAPGDARVGVVTTDRAGDGGYNASLEGYQGDYLALIDYTRVFAGTSASTPVVSGVAALLLELRPDLGWRDVKEIFLRASTPLQASDAAWTTRPAGDSAHPIRHHPRLGGGMVNALASLDLARTWTPLGPETNLVAGPLFPEKTIPDAGAPVVIAFPDFPGAGDPTAPDPVVLRVEHVELTLDITHPYRGDLEIILTSPAGVTSVFATPARADSGADYRDADGTDGYTFTSARHWGEASIGPGNWTVSVRDAFPRDTGTLHSARLTLHGTRLTVPEIVAEPAPRALATGSTLVLAATFTGGNLDYQWTREGQPIPGATAPVYRLDNFSGRAAGSYACVVRNPLGERSTTPVAITLDDSARHTLTLRAGQTADLALDPSPDGSRAWSATGLPAGLSIDPYSGLITGFSQKFGARRAIAISLTPDGVRTLTPLQIVVEPLPAAVVGTWTGIVAFEGPYDSHTHGPLTLTLSAGGAYSGVWVDVARSRPFKGVLQSSADPAAGRVEIDLPPSRSSAYLGKRLALRLPFDGSPATGSALHYRVSPAPPAFPPATSDDPVVLRRVAYSKHQPADVLAGPYTFALADASPHQESALRGHAPGLLTIGRDGRVRWWIHPLDEPKSRSGSTFLTTGDNIPLVVFRTGASNTLLIDGWLRPGAAPDHPLSGTFRLLSSRPAHVVGGGHHRPTATDRLLGATDDAPGLVVTLDGPSHFASLPATDDLTITVTAKNQIRIDAPNTPRLSAKLDPASGLVRGGFVVVAPDPRNPARTLTRKVSYAAVLLSGEDRIVGGFRTPLLDPADFRERAGGIDFSPAAPAAPDAPASAP